MQFAQPLWLLLGAIACAAILWQYRRFDRAQRTALAQFAAARLLPRLTSSVSATRRRWKRGLFALGIGLLFVALARPQVGFEWQDTHRKGLELLFAVDTSKSMLAQDVKPDRLTRAKLGVSDLVAKLNGDGVGLIAFAGNSFLQCPVTLDYDAFRESLEALDTNTIPHGGTDIASAIREAAAVFKTRTSTEKILVLITDGEDLGGEGIAAAQEAAKSGVKIFSVGVGSTTGELVPIPSENGGTDFARDENGQLVKSHLDDATLKKIADATGGMYQPLGAQGEGLTKIYEQGLARFARQDLSSRRTKVPLERFHWALLAALVCFMTEILIGNRRVLRLPQIAPAPAKKHRVPGLRPATAALALCAGLAGAHGATPQSAEQAYRKGDFARAQQEYAATAAQHPTQAELQFNTGSATYKTGDYAKAASDFQQSIKTGDVPVQQSAYYNLGNAQYRLGQKTEKEKPQETIKTWEEAVKSYDAALQIASADTAAKHNRDLVQRKIEQLKKQEEQKKQDQKSQPQKQENKDQKNDSKDQQKSSQDSKSNSKDQKGGSKDQQDQSKDQNGNPKDGQGGADNQKNEPQKSGADQQKKPDQGKDQKDGHEARKDKDNSPGAEAQKDESKDHPAGDKPQPGAENKNQSQGQAQAGDQEQPKPVNSEKKPSQGQAQAANGEQSPQPPAAAAEERREPGQMTKEEANQLLDALKDGERKAPAISAQGRAAAQPNEKKLLKDW